MLNQRVPAACDCSVTNVCNAACDFCGFSRDKRLAGPARYVPTDDYTRALPLLHRRGIRFMTLQGGEPLVHPDIVGLVAATTGAGMQCNVITNGWFLPRHIDSLVEAGLARLTISIDSDRQEEHERNRGLDGLTERIAKGIAQAHAHDIPVTASVTVNRLVDYDALPTTLRRLGFDAVGFSYPRRDPFGSSSLVFGAESTLVDLEGEELLSALAAIGRLKSRFPVVNPRASLTEVEHYVRGEKQAVPCVGGYKYFYMDWNLDIWRCEAWSEPLGSVFDLDHIPDQREPCHGCIMACYRNASMFMHAGVAASDAVQALAAGNVRAAAAVLFRRSVGQSVRALIEEMPQIRRLSRRRESTRAIKRHEVVQQ
jgi:MoaA/NifB/PqqE/SkfB family radical SAM enzyme